MSLLLPMVATEVTGCGGGAFSGRLGWAGECHVASFLCRVPWRGRLDGWAQWRAFSSPCVLPGRVVRPSHGDSRSTRIGRAVSPPKVIVMFAMFYWSKQSWSSLDSRGGEINPVVEWQG